MRQVLEDVRTALDIVGIHPVHVIGAGLAVLLVGYTVTSAVNTARDYSNNITRMSALMR